MVKLLHDTPHQVPTLWVVERLDIDGEELPVIRHAETWLPAPIALRYVLRTRFRLGPASLINNLRAITILYNWAEIIEGVGNFEDFLTSGKVLSRDQLLTFIPHLQRLRHQEWAAMNMNVPDDTSMNSLVCDQTFNTRLFSVQKFLEWAVEPTNHGGLASFDEDEREIQTTKMARLFEKERLPVGDSTRREPLTISEVLLIRKAIAPDEFGNFPLNTFTEATRYRNWIMFETALNLGVRKGELLTLKVAHLPADVDVKHFFVPRQQDAAEDTRKRRRLRGKTNERHVPLMNPSLLPSILGYRDAPLPIGRKDPLIKTPYLFVSKEGRPISSSAADHVIKLIGKYAAQLVDCDTSLDEHERMRQKESLLTLSWHRLRHTWAEQAAKMLYRMHGSMAWAILKEWGGWNSDDSMQRYTVNARRENSDEAGRKYLSSFTQAG
jgi:integrase